MRYNRVLYIAAFLMDLCAGLAVFTVPLAALDLGASAVDLGLIGTAGSLAYTLGCAQSGKIADRHDRRRLMMAASLGVAIVFFIMSIAGSVWMLIAAMMMSSFVQSFYWPALQADLAEGRNRGHLVRALSTFNMVWTMGFLTGPLTGGFLFQLDHRLPFYIGIGSALLIVGFLGLIPLKKEVASSDMEMETPDADRIRLTPQYRSIAWIASFTAFFSLAMMGHQFPKLAAELEIRPALLGVLMAFPRTLQFIIFLIYRSSHRWQYRLYPLILPQVGAIIGMTLIATQSHPLALTLAFGPVGILVGSAFSSSQFYALFQEARKGSSGAFNEMIIGMGNVSGPLLGGILAHTLGLRAPYALCIAVLIAGMAVEYRIARRMAKL